MYSECSYFLAMFNQYRSKVAAFPRSGFIFNFNSFGLVSTSLYLLITSYCVLFTTQRCDNRDVVKPGCCNFFYWLYNTDDWLAKDRSRYLGFLFLVPWGDVKNNALFNFYSYWKWVKYSVNIEKVDFWLLFAIQ